MLRSILLVLALTLVACSPAADVSTTSIADAQTDSDFSSAPDFPAGLDWLNTDRPLSFDQLRGKVVLLDFWTYGCINCIHIIPDLERLEEEFADELVVIGVHSAKFDAESNTENIRQIVLRYDIKHPVVNDPDFEVWSDWGARAWPTVFVVDPLGGVVGLHAGEGVYEVVQPVIANLIEEYETELNREPLDLALESEGLPATVLSFPGKVLADETGDRLFISDTNHHRVLQVRISDGQITAAFGSGRAGFTDGNGTGADFHSPQGLVLTDTGSTLLVADTENHAIRSVDLSTGSVTTIAGTGVQAAYPPSGGPVESTPLSSPWDLAPADDGGIYVAMAGTHQIWLYRPVDGSIGPFAGSAREGTLNATLASSELAQPSGLAVDALGRLYFADSESSAIRVVDPSADEVRLVAGGQESLFDFGDVDGRGNQARFQHPLGVAVAGDYVWVADTYNSKIKRIDPLTGEVVTFAGAGAGWADGGDPRFYEPGGIAAGNQFLYIADTNNHSIRTVDYSTGEAVTFVLKGAEEFLPTADNAAYAGRKIEVDPVAVSPGDIEIVLNVTLPDGYKVNEDAPSRFEFTVDGTGSAIEVPGVIVNPQFPLSVTARAVESTTELVGEVSVVYCETEFESICLIDQVRLIVPIDIAAQGTQVIDLSYTIEAPEI